MLAWIAPTSRVDGSPLQNLAGYRIYYGTNASGLLREVQIDNPSAITWTITGLSPGNWYFVVTAVDADGLESAYSNMASKTVE